MSLIAGVTINWNLSPRVITIPNTETAVTIVDLQDTLLQHEDDTIGSGDGMMFLHTRNTSGGENLGGGTSVGFTMELQNAQISFGTRFTKLESGTITTPDATGVTLIDSTATFITNGVTAGDVVRSHTDIGSVAAVLSVDSEIQLTTEGLQGGVDNQFDSADSYDVMDWIPCSITGGNLVAVDDVAAELDPVFPTFGTRVTRTSSSSATLQEQADIEYASFNSGVTVDTTSIYTGGVFPVGTPRQPVNNLVDALAIATTRGFTKLFIKDSQTIDSGLNFTSFTFEGLSRSATVITVDTAANVTNCTFTNCVLEGTLDGGSLVFQSNIGTLDYVNGIIKECVIDGPITLGGASPLEAMFINTESGIAGATAPTINMGGNGPDLMVRGHSGGLNLTNKSGTNPASIDIAQGQVILDATVTAGTLVIRGIASVTDNSVGATVIDETINTSISGIAGGLTFGEYISQT